MVRIVKHKLNKHDGVVYSNLSDAAIKKKLKELLPKYSGVQVFDSQSITDSEDDFETLFKCSNKILVRLNIVYDYLEVITYHLSLHDWIWTNFVKEDPDIHEGFLIK